MSLYDNVVPLVPRNLSRFGVCPRCGKAEGPIHQLGEQWLRCEQHRFKWRIGGMRLGGWQNVDPLEQLAETARLMGLWEIEPYYPGSPHGPGDAA
jgi:hypothetical protein